MLKWNQFESKNKNKKNPKPLIKRRVKQENDAERKRQEIAAKMNVFVNGPTGFAENYKYLTEENGFNTEIKITPEWILSKFSWSQNASDGNIFISADIYNSHWVELALDTLGISFIRVEDIDYNGKTFITFKLIFEGFKEIYPS
ncbi:hypothetical protein AQPE_2725 [Aquipluma nitroreducens]|uniref:Uncharacterized protein n=1 Tax=Aquipluma nitroreducens TaxID=2010828 RepID=A0A5K7SAH2_9BACT|nr:hypothetical protein [Aquipluma nitroreducens]BBE18562.1 hypothetical protein AQPE_2725 [Aquipluma nitroreducens]